MSAELEAGEAGWLDEFVLALAARGVTDRWVGQQRAWVRELLAFARVPVWAVGPANVDSWLAAARARGAGTQTRAVMAHCVHCFYVFLQTRHGQEIEEVTGWPVPRPVDEFNQPRRLAGIGVRIPPSVQEIEAFFTAWRLSVAGVGGRGFMPAARDYVAASLWRRVGLRLNETVRLQVGDWYPHAGARGMLHVRCGKGARGSGPGSGWCRPSMGWTGCFSGGCPRCAPSSATILPTVTRCCCPAAATTDPAAVCGRRAR